MFLVFFGLNMVNINKFIVLILVLIFLGSSCFAMVANWLIMKGNNPKVDVEACNPLFMVKDFDSKEFKIDNSFMTNADAAVLSCKDLIENPVNPFTGKKIDGSEKYAHPQIVVAKATGNPSRKLVTTFGIDNKHMLTVHDDIFKEENWEMVE